MGVSTPLFLCPMIDPDKLQKFFDERPAISVRKIEKEAGLPNTKIKEFIKGHQRLSTKQDASLQNVLVRYGSIPASGLSLLIAKSLIE